jgi:hypothetical protein
VDAVLAELEVYADHYNKLVAVPAVGDGRVSGMWELRHVLHRAVAGLRDEVAQLRTAATGGVW